MSSSMRLGPDRASGPNHHASMAGGPRCPTRASLHPRRCIWRHKTTHTHSSTHTHPLHTTSTHTQPHHTNLTGRLRDETDTYSTVRSRNRASAPRTCHHHHDCAIHYHHPTRDDAHTLTECVSVVTGGAAAAKANRKNKKLRAIRLCESV